MFSSVLCSSTNRELWQSPSALKLELMSLSVLVYEADG